MDRLLFNSLSKLQTKPLPPIRHICDFSRGVLNVRFMRSHPTLAPRPQICLIGGNGFCAVAGEGELNSKKTYIYFTVASVLILHPCAKVIMLKGKDGVVMEVREIYKISDMIVFYNDKDILVSVKLSVYNNGCVLIYVYGDKGNKLVQEIKTAIDINENEIFELAVILRNEADDKRVWDSDIEKINTDIVISDDMIIEYKSHEKYYEKMRMRKEMLGLGAYVSKKIIEEDWKVGYMSRDEAMHEGDSGWAFMAGNEDDDYVNDYRNIALCSIYEVCRLDPAVGKYIVNPVGTKMIRVSSSEFEIDNNDRKIYLEKR